MGLLSYTGSLLTRIKDIILQTNAVYFLYLKTRHGVGKPLGYPDACKENAVLKTRREWKSAVEQVRKLGLYSHMDPQKNWDALAALNAILNRTSKEAYILDGGCELPSTILSWLFLYGYKNLLAVNLIFHSSLKRGPIRYEYADITQTTFKDESFDAITCLSVIEHGVDFISYFKEVARILKPGGILITSTDYYETPIDIKGLKEFGVPIHIFSKGEITAALDVAKKYGLELTGALDLDCCEKAVRWEGSAYDFEYTFLVFTMQKK